MHKVASLAKRWLLGTHQGAVDDAHLASYLNEFVFRFNRRRSRSRSLVFYRVLELAAGHDPARYRDLIASPPNRRAGPAVAVADALADRLWGVRFDTSEAIVDRALEDAPGDRSQRTGVTPQLARSVRQALDDGGHRDVRIVVSGGFDAARIERFEAEAAPVDAYGVGSSLVRGANNFTADIVRVNGRPCAKVGREDRPNPRLRHVD